MEQEDKEATRMKYWREILIAGLLIAIVATWILRPIPYKRRYEKEKLKNEELNDQVDFWRLSALDFMEDVGVWKAKFESEKTKATGQQANAKDDLSKTANDVKKFQNTDTERQLELYNALRDSAIKYRRILAGEGAIPEQDRMVDE